MKKKNENFLEISFVLFLLNDNMSCFPKTLNTCYTHSEAYMWISVWMLTCVLVCRVSFNEPWPVNGYEFSQRKVSHLNHYEDKSS